MSDTTGGTISYDSPLSIALRGGGDLVVWPDRVTSGAEIYSLAELTRAAVVSAPITANIAAPGAALIPALLLQLRDGRAPLFVPSDPPDAARALELLLRLRPNLAVTSDDSQSSNGSAVAPKQQPIPQVASLKYVGNQTARWEGIAPTDRVLAGLSHLSVFYMPLLLPFILWLALRGGSPYASRQAKQAFFFHLLVLALVAVIIVPAWIVLVLGGLTLATTSGSGNIHTGGATLSISSLVCGGAFLIALSVGLIVYGVYGAVQAFMGKPFHYPLLRRL